jgi:cysteinyl-tRNA synthetase
MKKLANLTLKQMILNEIDNAPRGYSEELAIVSGTYSNGSNLKKVLTDEKKEFEQILGVIRIVEYIWESESVKMMVKYSNEVDPNKKNPLDFVLWFTNSKFKNQIMQWDSPWGRGFPGWHIECSAMSMKYIGERIDIHCGGVDHIPVHHTNEIAQSEAAIGHKWVNYWVHGEFLVLDGAKMSKSTGEFLTVSKLEGDGFNPLDYRYFCLQSRYRKQLVFSYESLKDAKTAYGKLKSKITAIAEGINENDTIDNVKINNYKESFINTIGDDLNMPNAFTVLWDVIKDEKLNNKEKIYLIEDFDRVFSLELTKPEEVNNEDIDTVLIGCLIEQRNEARKNKDWAKADEMRNKLLDMGIEIKDTKEGTIWKKKA